MKPPKPYRIRPGRLQSFSRCIACDKFKESNMIFHHEGRHWILCKWDYADYWENTDELLDDYKGYA